MAWELGGGGLHYDGARGSGVETCASAHRLATLRASPHNKLLEVDAAVAIVVGRVHEQFALVGSAAIPGGLELGLAERAAGVPIEA
eukprot:scaffold142163_cov28-Tisochrysis_lutea.AAC.2